MRWGFWEIILIVVLIALLFGSAKIPGMMRNLAGGIKAFKQEIKEEKPKKKQAVARKTPKKSK